jgi:hypothetical protein
MSRINLDTVAKIWRSALPKGCNKLVLQAFAHHINSDPEHPHFGLAWPSVKRVALMCGMKERTAQAHIRTLRAAGLLRPQRRAGATTLYAVVTDSLEPLVFTTDIVDLDADGKPVDNSRTTAFRAVDNLAAPCPSPANFAKIRQDFCAPRADFCSGDYQNLHPKASLTFDLKLEDSQSPAAPASPVQPYPHFGDIKPETLADFAASRKSKFGPGAKGKVTAELISQIAAEAELAGMTLQAALEHCCHPERRWASFKAEWFKPKAPASAPPAPVAVFVPEPERTAEDIERSRAAKEAAMAAYTAKLATEAATAPPAAQPDSAPAAATPCPPPAEALPCPATAPKPAPAAAPAMPSCLDDIVIPANAPKVVIDLVSQLKAGHSASNFSRGQREYAASFLKIPVRTLRASPSLSH